MHVKATGFVSHPQRTAHTQPRTRVQMRTSQQQRQQLSEGVNFVCRALPGKGSSWGSTRFGSPQSENAGPAWLPLPTGEGAPLSAARGPPAWRTPLPAKSSHCPAARPERASIPASPAGSRGRTRRQRSSRAFYALLPSLPCKSHSFVNCVFSPRFLSKSLGLTILLPPLSCFTTHP
jgi:hypothetical protein